MNGASSPIYDPERALDLLRLGTGQSDAGFREGQEEAIRYVVNGEGRLLLVQKTGWGKSFVYFIATKLLRERDMGPVVLISPLLALMRNQIDAAHEMNLQAETINSANEDDWDRVTLAVGRDEVDILLISPERFANEAFRDRVLQVIASRVAMLVIDEAHCVSDWGHDFRPYYRFIERIVKQLPPDMRVLGTTATANQRVMDDLREVLGPDLEVVRGDLYRPSLALQTRRLASPAERLAYIDQALRKIEGSGIIYALTIRDVGLVTEWLSSRGLNVKPYTGKSGEERPMLEQELLRNKVKALVATTALGMGFDKPDLSFVIHFQAPGSVVAYYQQVGRAGRALDLAYGILLSGAEEGEIVDYFIHSAFPSREEVREVLEALEASEDGLSIPGLLAKVNISYGRIEKTMQLLSLESPAPVVKVKSKWKLAAADLDDAFWQRAERLTSLRLAERDQMQEYVNLTSGHMEFLVRALDGEPRGEALPLLDPIEVELDPGVLQEAIGFLKRTNIPIAPRKKWPAGGMEEMGVRGIIASEGLNEEGRALCMFGDEGWSRSVESGKYSDKHFDDGLVAACADLVSKWKGVNPSWVTFVPSITQRGPDIVKDFALRLAGELGLEFVEAVGAGDPRPAQRTMKNSSRQALNLAGAFLIDSKVDIPADPVLLVDDIVDSRWSMTVAGYLLREHGSGPVFPLALALVGGK